MVGGGWRWANTCNYIWTELKKTYKEPTSTEKDRQHGNLN